MSFTLAPSNVFTYTYGQAIEVPDSVTTLECRYFITEAFSAAATADTVETRPLYGVYDIMTIANEMWLSNVRTQGDTIEGNPKPDNDWLQGSLFLKGKDTYTLRNQSNEDVTIEAFRCTLRKDYNQNDGQVQNVYRLLGRGFGERGFDASNAGAFNAALYRSDVTPFDSTLFTRLVKISKRWKFKIKAGEYKNVYLSGGWKRYRPIEYTSPSTAANNQWSQQTQMYDYLKGSKFILFRVMGSLAMKTGQVETQFSREIAQTTPLVIMATQRHYQAKHIKLPPQGLVAFTTVGVAIDANAVIMTDNTKVEGKEAEAE